MKRIQPLLSSMRCPVLPREANKAALAHAMWELVKLNSIHRHQIYHCLTTAHTLAMQTNIRGPMPVVCILCVTKILLFSMDMWMGHQQKMQHTFDEQGVVVDQLFTWPDKTYPLLEEGQLVSKKENKQHFFNLLIDQLSWKVLVFQSSMPRGCRWLWSQQLRVNEIDEHCPCWWWHRFTGTPLSQCSNAFKWHLL